LKHILSYGGGVNSSALFFFLIEKNLPLDLVIFADTGEELKSTYEAVKNMQLVCLEKKIPFKIVKSHLGNLYDYYWDKKCVMSIQRRDCTGKFKVSPIRKYLRETFGKKEKFLMYLGITYEEATRMRTSDVLYITNSYPFVDFKITRQGNISILDRYGFKAFKSGCKGCVFNRKATWVSMLKKDLLEFERHKGLEMNNRRYPEITISGKYSLLSLEKAVKSQKRLDGFSDSSVSCDVVNGGCFL